MFKEIKIGMIYDKMVLMGCGVAEALVVMVRGCQLDPLKLNNQINFFKVFNMNTFKYGLNFVSRI